MIVFAIALLSCHFQLKLISLKIWSNSFPELFVIRYILNVNVAKYSGGSEFSSCEIEVRNRVAQNDVTLRVTNSDILLEILLSSY